MSEIVQSRSLLQNAAWPGRWRPAERPGEEPRRPPGAPVPADAAPAGTLMLRGGMGKRMTTDREWRPPELAPGPETEALGRFVWNGTRTGTVEPGGMGPGSPPMDAKGRATCTWDLHGLWADCLFEQDQFVDGRPVLNWQARWLMGWDRDANEYRAVGADTNGRTFIFHGRIEGSRLVMETLGESPAKLLFTWEVVDERTVTWKNEVSFGGGPLELIETYRITRSD